ncbi:3-ketoacyl-CoA synthase 6-like [Magnolia sinica]|uniref:3-ketoacyl-CoA synthase 6-like n=1 Tax=Magnolia sinica TaxID=86752 RepID=UPI00265A1392|nr:3-ketoacyl-CoA synthase 6-like [Magnolia sinica]
MRYRAPSSGFLENATVLKIFDEASISFMAKVMAVGGYGEETYLPPLLHYIPPRTRNQDSIQEAHMLYFPVMDDLLNKTNISPLEIDILIVNCSGFCPAPSLSSIIVNRYTMRSDVKTFNLSGMGCSAGSIGINVARNLLQVHKNSYAVIVSGEIISTGWYSGKDRSKLLLNCSFRMGSSAVLLTNRKAAKETSKYKIMHVVRTQTASDDKAYNAAIRKEDSEGITGFSLDRQLFQSVAESLHANITALGAVVLPLHEKICYVVVSLLKKDVYIPNFGSVVQHYCLPSSGLGLIREIGKGLKLKGKETEGAAVTLHRFGNLSAASWWYQMAYIEAKERVKKGDRVWQLWMGSGIKCASVVLECLRSLDGDDEKKKGPWFDCVDPLPDC